MVLAGRNLARDLIGDLGFSNVNSMKTDCGDGMKRPSDRSEGVAGVAES